MTSNPFKYSGNIQIRLVRNSNEEQDDRIVIKYKDEDCYQIFFQDGYMNQSATYCTVLSGEELDTYIESLFNLLSRDRDPFQAIEFQIPCFPCLRYEVQDLLKKKVSDTLKTIMPILYSGVRVSLAS